MTVPRTMIAGSLFALLLSMGRAVAGRAPTPPEPVEWRDATQFDVEGRGWTETESPYDRLPAHAKAVVPRGVWGLSKDSAGLCVRFQACGRLNVRWTLSNAMLAMPHMPATGVSGVDLYARSVDGRWRFMGNGRPEGRTDADAQFDLGGDKDHLRECLLYLPLYNGVKKVEIGLPAASRIERADPRPPERSRPILVYGTSIDQGGCASRPGMAWTAILGRKLERAVINLGFSGSGKMEPEVDDCIAETDPAAFVINCLANMANFDDDLLSSRVETLVKRLRKARPETPIVLVGQSSIHPDAHPMRASRLQEAVARRLRHEGIRGLSVVSGADLLGHDGEGTVDGVHPNDLGMMRQAEALAPILARILARTSP